MDITAPVYLMSRSNTKREMRIACICVHAPHVVMPIPDVATFAI